MNMKQRVTITQLICQRCRHTWIPRVKPVRQCPKCKSVHWEMAKEPRPAPAKESVWP
jgi:predicted Zn-ribbon and HTH transcriptional regulator